MMARLLILLLSSLLLGSSVAAELNVHAVTDTLITNADGKQVHRVDYRTDGTAALMPASLTNSLTLWYAFSHQDQAGTNYLGFKPTSVDGIQTTVSKIPAFSSDNGGQGEFDGTADFVSFGEFTQSNTTIFAVVRLDGHAASEIGILGWGQADNNTYLRLSYATTLGWVQVGYRTASGAYYIRRSASAPPTNVIQCMVGTINVPLEINKYYLNGTEIALPTILNAGSQAATLTDTCMIGGRDGTAYWFFGDFLEGGIFNRVLTSNEITNVLYPALAERHSALP